MKRILFTLLGLISITAMAQEKCGVVKKYYQNPDEMKIIRKHFEGFKTWRNNRSAYDTSVKYIPTVVHVFHNNGPEKISKAQVERQIEILNKDYRRLNTDTLNTPKDFRGNIAADTKIEFFLARKDENGNCTDGIVYYQSSTTDHSSSSTYDDLTKFSRWDVNKYLNIYVVKSIDGTNNVLGYAASPGAGAATDVFVVDNNYFGTGGTTIAPYSYGRTTTHEIGHWLGLMHTWGPGNYDGFNCNEDDGIDDTPDQEKAHFGCDDHPAASCNNDGDMFMNYMDYSDDACMNMFTTGQKEMMHYSLENNQRRASVIDSANVSNTGFYIPEIKYNVSYGCEGTTFEWSIVGDLVDSVVWFKDGIQFANTTNAVTMKIDDPGKYDITARVYGGECLADTITRMFPIYGCLIGVEETELQKEELTVNYNGSSIEVLLASDHEKMISIYNALGQSVYQTVTSDQQLNIPFSSIHGKGIHIIQVIENKQQYSQQIIVY